MSAPRPSASTFWSRRKAAVEAEQEAERAARLAELQAEEEAKLEALSDEELLAELNLPEPEAMDSPDQVQALLKSAVPQRLKTRALRRLWRLNPVLANIDGLVDYGEDFTDAANVVENLQTTYQVGKGMLKALEWESPKAAEADAEADTDSADADKDAADLDAADPDAGAPKDTSPSHSVDTDSSAGADMACAAPQADASVQPAPSFAVAPDPVPSDDFSHDPMPATARRMRFRFDASHDG